MKNAATSAASPASAPLVALFLSTFSVIPSEQPAAPAPSGQGLACLLPRPPGRPARLGDGSAPQPVRRSVPRKELPGEVRTGELALSPHHIVHGLVAVAERLRALEVQVGADDARAAAVDESHRPVVVDGFDDSHVGEAIVATAIAVAIVRVAEEHQIS